MEKKNFEDILPKLTKIPLFEGFDPDKDSDREILLQLYEGLGTKTFKPGQVIIKEGEVGDEFYILYSGSVHISRATPAGDSIALADLNASMNIFFGETALISNDTRSATVTAIEECKVLVLTSRKFHELCQKQTVLGYRVMLKLAQRMINTINQTNKDKAMLYQALYNEIAGN
ncbi:MAG: cyclic nucleotide-binding domain-containing protein [Treponema sp.]|nr:cyclic nucleotide-binding domain-containing protein [Treponema sp.]